MENECLYPCLQNPAAGPCLHSDDPIHNFLPYFPKIHFNIIHLCLGLPAGLFPSGSQTKIFYGFYVSHACYMSRPSHPP